MSWAFWHRGQDLRDARTNCLGTFYGRFRLLPAHLMSTDMHLTFYWWHSWSNAWIGCPCCRASRVYTFQWRILLSLHQTGKFVVDLRQWGAHRCVGRIWVHPRGRVGWDTLGQLGGLWNRSRTDLWRGKCPFLTTWPLVSLYRRCYVFRRRPSWTDWTQLGERTSAGRNRILRGTFNASFLVSVTFLPC